MLDHTFFLILVHKDFSKDLKLSMTFKHTCDRKNWSWSRNLDFLSRQNVMIQALSWWLI